MAPPTRYAWARLLLVISAGVIGVAVGCLFVVALAYIV